MIKPITVIWVGLLTLILVIGGTASVVFFTPAIRKQIPGYLNPQYETKLKSMLVEIEDLNQIKDHRDSLLTAMRILTSGMSGGRAIAATAAPDQRLPASPKPTQQAQPIGQQNPQVPEQEVMRVYVTDKSSSSSASREMLNLFQPVTGDLIRGFDHKRKHYGVDIAADKQASIHSATDGQVIYSEYSDQNGYVIGISSPGGVVSFYKHNSRLLYNVGDVVLAGDEIAVVGNTGENTTGPHLHFELWLNGRAVDPMDYFASFK